MSNDNYFYGLDAEIQKKISAKFDAKKAAQAMAWLEAVTGHAFKSNSIHENLKDGVVLCEAANKITPGTISSIEKSSNSPFKHRVNIENYLKGCKALGMKDVDLFMVVDLYDGQNLTQVIDQICALGGIAQKLNPNLPAFGVKYSDENPRNFTDEQLNTASIAPKLNMGSYGIQDDSKNPIIDRQIIKNVSGHTASSAPTQISQGSIQHTNLSGIDKIIRNPDLIQRGAAAANEPASPSGASKFCGQCGTARTPGAKFCGNCGNHY